MINALLAAAPGEWSTPDVDYFAIAPEIVVAAGICLVIIVDLFVEESKRWMTAAISGFVLLGAIIPVVALGLDDTPARMLFDGRYVVDDFSIIFKALFLLAGYVVVLLSQQYVEDGDYYQGEYYALLLTSVLGMMLMPSARDLVGIFVALETLAIPTYMLASWRKRDSKSNEAGIKYYLLGVFSSAVMLYGMSLLYGVAGSTRLTDIGAAITGDGEFGRVGALSVVFVLVGFAFKVSAVPFHSWSPDVYEGAPTPITAFLSVSSKAAGFVALVTLVYVGFPAAKDTWQPFLWVLAALTMTVGNVLALRQSNVVRMFAYSSISQAGFILMPLAVAGTGDAAKPALESVVTYLFVYAATNLGVFAVIIAVARKTRSGEISSYGGLMSYAPGLATLMTLFLASLAGIPPLGGWIGKFTAFRAALDAGNGWGYTIAVIAAVNSAVAFGYYGNLMREMWMKPVPDGDTTPIRTPSSLSLALGITTIATLGLGILPGLITHFAEITTVAAP